MITYSSKFRSNQAEIMDDFNLQGESMKVLLTDLHIVNKLLGGNSITIDGIKKLLALSENKETLTLLDIGCGDGAILRECVSWAEQRGLVIKIIGVDANPHILEEARKRSKSIRNATFKVIDVFSAEEQLPAYDIALCTLFTHHFKEDQILQLLHKLVNEAKVGVVINDLHRSRCAFWLFRLFSVTFLKTKIAKHDGLVSVARGFKRRELNNIAQQISGTHYIQWKWAFRYQWIIKSNNKH